jgi:hypothetical protein
VWGQTGIDLYPHTTNKGYKRTIMKKYTLKQIIKMWEQIYGENLKTEYSGFYKLLKKGK